MTLRNKKATTTTTTNGIILTQYASSSIWLTMWQGPPTRPSSSASLIKGHCLKRRQNTHTHKTTLSNCSPFSEGDIGDFCDSYHVRSGSSMLEQEVHLTCHLSPCFSHSPYERMWIFLHHNPSCSHGDWSSLKKFTRCSMKRLIPPVPRYKSELKLLSQTD